MSSLRFLPLLWAGLLPAQSLQLYSEFQRIDPFGNAVAADRTGPSREILSPAVVRNAWTSFHLACTVAEGPASILYIQQNPALFQVTVYRELFVKTPAGWIPDGLEKVRLPHFIVLPDILAPIPKQTTVVFWLDIWVPAKTPVGRMRFQALLKAADRWLVYPMEVRVQETVVPDLKPAAGPLPPIAARADAALVGLIRRRLCAALERGQTEASPTVRALLRRNALQDLALAPRDLGQMVSEGGQPAKEVCAAPGTARDPGAEWWLGVRRLLYGRRTEPK